MKRICYECKKKKSEGEMLWLVWIDKDICVRCYDKHLKKGFFVSPSHPYWISIFDEEE